MRVAIIILAATAVLSWSAQAAVPSFQSLGCLPEFTGTFAHAISGNGLTVVGSCSRSNGTEYVHQAFVWTRESGLVALGTLSEENVQSSAYGVSFDGSVIVGSVESKPVRWGLPGSAEELQGWGIGGGLATAVSANGQVVIGRWQNAGFRWTASTGMENIGALEGGDGYCEPYGVSANGSVIVGNSRSASGNEGFRWEAGQMEGLGVIGTAPESHYHGSNGRGGVSADGLIAAGSSTSPLGTEAFRWTSDGGQVGLGDLPGSTVDSIAFGISGDGMVIIGSGKTEAGGRPFIWDQTHGMRNLQELLVDNLDLDLGGMILTDALGVSADGLTIIGVGISDDGYCGAWIAEIPEPTTLSLLFLGALAILRSGRFRAKA